MTKVTKNRGRSKSRYVRFNLKRSKPIDRPTLILAVFRYWVNDKPQKLVYSTKNSIAPNRWNKKERLPRTIDENGDKIDNEITKLILSDLHDVKTAIEDVHSNFPKILVPEFIQKLDDYLGRSKIEPSSEFIGYFQSFIDKSKLVGGKSKGTITRYQSTLNKIKSFEQINNVSLGIEDINKDFHQRFGHYVYSNGSNSPNTLSKHFKITKMILEDAETNGLTINSYCKSKQWRVKEENAPILALDTKQLDKISNLDLGHDDRLKKVRDWFLVACYTGLAIVDLKRLKKEKIIKNNGRAFIQIHRQKTKRKVLIPLTDKLESILKEYNYNAPIISDQKFNEYIKEVAKKAGLNKSIPWKVWDKGEMKESEIKIHDAISSHTGRRSFCTNLYERGIPMMLILQSSGHASESQFLKYIGRSQKEQADKLFDLMNEDRSKQKVV